MVCEDLEGVPVSIDAHAVSSGEFPEEFQCVEFFREATVN
jgi:hypothetical protein